MNRKRWKEIKKDIKILDSEYGQDAPDRMPSYDTIDGILKEIEDDLYITDEEDEEEDEGIGEKTDFSS